MSLELLITDDFNSVRRCGSEAEMREVARILISAAPDCVALDAASPDLVNYNSKIGLRIEGSPFDVLFEEGCDPFGFMVDRLKEADIRVLANIRMNDHHGKPIYWTPWEREHVAWSLGKDSGARDWKSIGALRQMDYAVKGVRDYRLSILAEILELFDVDGIQLDFGRTAPFVSDPKPENARFMTDFVRSARRLLDRSNRGGAHPSLGVLLPWDLEFCAQEGLAVPEWISEKLVDFVSPGEWYYADGNLPLAAWSDLVKGTGCRLLPFTPGNVSPYQDFEYGERSALGDNRVLDGAKLRAINDNFASQGSDGIALYNFYTFDFGHHYPELRSWVDPHGSAGKSRHHFNGRQLVYHATERDAFDLGLAFARAELTSVGDAASRSFRFPGGSADRETTLRCAFLHYAAGDEIEVRLNDTVLRPTGLQISAANGSDPGNVMIWEGKVDLPPLARGRNRLDLRLLEASPARARPIKVGEFEVLVEGDP